MSMLPFYQRYFRTGDWWDPTTLGRLFDQNFGTSMLDDDPFFNQSMLPSMAPYWLRSHTRPLIADKERGTSEVRSDSDQFVINLDVSHFTPEEIKVKLVDNNLTICGQHEERMDQHGFVSRSFMRRYVLPKDVDGAKLTSSLSPGGVLRVEAPKLMPAIQSNERQIPIQFGTASKTSSISIDRK